jgi:hypothetical protein
MTLRSMGTVSLGCLLMFLVDYFRIDHSNVPFPPLAGGLQGGLELCKLPV